MRKKIVSSFMALVASAGVALAQPPADATAPKEMPKTPAALVAPAPAPMPPKPPCPADALPSACCPEEVCVFPCLNVCGPPGRVWVSAEYLYWGIKDYDLPPLETTSPLSSGGVIGAPGTRIIAGDSTDYDIFSGGRFTVGMWLNECQTKGIEGTYLFLYPLTDDWVFAGNGAPGSPTLARPFFNILSGMEDAQLEAAPGIVAGRTAISSSTRLQGAEVNGICNLCCGCDCRVDLLAGVRWLQLEEGLTISEDLRVLPNIPVIGGTRFALYDQFSTQNNFYGGQVGVRGEVRRNRLFFGAEGKIALGYTEQIIDIRGMTTVQAPGRAPVTLNGGLLALPSNIGHYYRNEFSVIPELGVRAGVQVSCNVRAFVGYSFLYWCNVARPGDQISLDINPTLVPATGGTTPVIGPRRPAPTLLDTDFWAQGVNFGIELRF